MGSLTIWNRLAVVGLVALLGVAARGQGLYGDEAKDLKKGDIKSRDYWQAKFDAMMLEEAIKTHQPEGKIGVNVAIFIRNLGDLIKSYPSHEDLKKWKARAEEVQKKINPDANRSEPWKPGFLWDDANYAQAWVSMHLAPMAEAENDAELAFMHYSHAATQFKMLVEADRMKDYPEDAVKWVKEQKVIADQKAEEFRVKTHH